MTDTREFFHAVEAGNAERVGALLTSTPDLTHARDATGATALHHAAFHGYKPLVQLLVDHGADINARDGEHDATPSGWAIHHLRELGGLLAIEIEDVLHAIETRDAEWAARLVTRHPALVHAVDRDGRPLASHARASGNETIASLFANATGGTAPATAGESDRGG